MRDVPDAELDDLAATIAVTRLVLGPEARIQAPPNLVGDQYELILRAGIDDWGGVSPLTPDHVNPERPWPQIDELAARTARGRVHPARAADRLPALLCGEPWLDPRLARHVAALADPATGLADEAASPHGLPWQEPDGGLATRAGRAAPTCTSPSTRPAAPMTGATISTRSTATGTRLAASPVAVGPAGAAGPGNRRLGRLGAPDGPVWRRGGRALRQAERDSGAADRRPGARAARRGRPGRWRRWRARRRAAPRRQSATTSPTSSTATSTSPTSATPAAGSALSPSGGPTPTRTRCRWSRSATGPQEAWAAGATEVCMQGGIHPDLPGTAYFELAAEVKRRCPGLHVHAFSPMEVVNGASRTGLPHPGVADPGQGGRASARCPGTAAEILDDDVRWVLTKGKLPAVGVDRGGHDRARARACRPRPR